MGIRGALPCAWDPNPDAREKIIASHHDADLWNREKWPDAIDWLVKTISSFRKVFMPRIKKLDLTKPPKAVEGEREGQ